MSFGVTGSVTYIPPFALARTFSSLDHLTEGRIAWNVVTSFSKAAADAFGTELLPGTKRYELGEEYMDVVYKYGVARSWCIYSILTTLPGFGTVHGRKTPCDMMRSIELLVNLLGSRKSSITMSATNVWSCCIDSLPGTRLKLSARYQLHPSPQRTPVVFQAGTSKSGQAFAARHAEAIYIGGMLPSYAAGQIKVSKIHPHRLSSSQAYKSIRHPEQSQSQQVAIPRP